MRVVVIRRHVLARATVAPGRFYDALDGQPGIAGPTRSFRRPSHWRRRPVPPTPHTLPSSLLLHLGPGLVVGAAYLALVPAARALGLPSAAALGAQGLLITGPLMIGIVKVSSRRRWPGEPTIALRRVPTVAAILGWATLILCAAAAAFVVTRPVKEWLERTLFRAWPDSWKPQLGTAGGYSDSALLWTAVLLLVGSVLIAPVVEEADSVGSCCPGCRHGSAAAPQSPMWSFSPFTMCGHCG